MFVSTTFPAYALRARPVRYGFGSPSLRTELVRSGLVRSTAPALSGRWADGAYELTVDLPGVPEEAISASVAGRTLTIDVVADELTWNERVRLPQTLDPELVSARYANGRLTVTIAKTAEATPRTIAIDTAPVPAELVVAGTPADGAQPEATEASVTE